MLHQDGSSLLDGASYTYDNAGNRTSKTNYINGVTSNYGYDPLYQLTQVTQGASTTESYSYDTVGNRLSSLSMPLYQYNASNELTSNSSGSYSYDANGNTLADASGKSYAWDFENRVVQALVPGTNGGTTTFKYDPFGRRIQKSGPLGTTNYLYDGQNLVEEVDSNANMLARYTQGVGTDQPLSELRLGATSYYQQDGLGSVTSLSNSSAALAQTYTSDSFGKPTASTGTLVNPFQYTGREFDSETGIFYYRARYFDPSAGRFLSEDSIRFRAGANFYPYVLNNPLRWRDPNGRKIDWGGLYDTWQHANSTLDWLNCLSRMGYCLKGLQQTTSSLNGMSTSAVLNTALDDQNRGNPNNTESNQRLNQCLRFDQNCAQGIQDCLKNIPLTPFEPPSSPLDLSSK